MTRAAALTGSVLEAARSLGFDRVGVVTDGDSRHAEHLRWWLEQAYHGEMAYLARADSVDRRKALTRSLDGFASAVVVAQEYGDEGPGIQNDDPSTAEIARYARGRDYHRVLAGALRRLHVRLPELAGRPVAGRVYVDTGPLLERELAQRAGLGWFGRNTMLIHPRAGSYAFLGVLLTDLPLEPSGPFEQDHCGTCRRCLDACPTAALLGRDESGAPVMDARRCISYLTIELRGPIPRELRASMGNRVFGCDICQEVCPFNERFSTQCDEPAYAARGPGEPPHGVQPLPEDRSHPGTDAPRLVDLMAMDGGEWESFSRGSPIRRAGRGGFLRNVAVALGNWGAPEVVPVLSRALADHEPLVRGHAAWALGRVGSREAARALRDRRGIEQDPYVLGEIRDALEP